MGENAMVSCALGRVVLQDGADRQLIYLVEKEGDRGFPIVIGSSEAHEIYRVLHGRDPDRPLTHKLAYDLIEALGATVKHVDVVALKNNTFYAQIALQNEGGDVLAVVDARPSDAIALAIRARCPIRVAEDVLGQASPGE
jgi:hypothetical protein